MLRIRRPSARQRYWVGGETLQATEDALTLVGRTAKAATSDGRQTETKEQLGGLAAACSSTALAQSMRTRGEGQEQDTVPDTGGNWAYAGPR